MLKILAKGLLARLLAYGGLGLGFWLLFQALQKSNVLLGLLGAVLIPTAMYLMVTSRKTSIMPAALEPVEDKEEEPVDSFPGSR